MKILKLLVTKKCLKNCPGCCNKDWDLDALPNVKHFNYDQILITGGEPLLFLPQLLDLCIKIREKSDTKIYIYTAMTDGLLILYPFVDGFTITIHKQSDVIPFMIFSRILNNFKKSPWLSKSLRLNVFKGIQLEKPAHWKVRENIEWKKNCPLPKNEVFYRLKNLWE